jgi:acyl-CoA synthetase (AMP-forming)/AMP-acid ligase II
VRGPGLFREYWGRKDATAAAFDADGFFMTGDVVALDGEQPPYYKARHPMRGAGQGLAQYSRTAPCIDTLLLMIHAAAPL